MSYTEPAPLGAGMSILGSSAEGIVASYPTLELGDVYATIALILKNREEVDAFMAKSEAEAERVHREWERQTSCQSAKRSGISFWSSSCSSPERSGTAFSARLCDPGTQRSS